jgi:hypothetical protein
MQAAHDIDKERFTFEELRSVLPGSYEETKSALFEVLSRKNAPLRQVFDKDSRLMRFQKLV